MSIFSDLALSRATAPAFASMGLFWGAFAAQAPALKAQTGLGDGAFGLALLVASVGALMAMWLTPRVQARLGARSTRILTLLFAAAWLLPGLGWNWMSFALAMLAASVVAGTLDVVMNADLSAIEARARRPLMNLNHAVFSFAYALSAALTGLAREAGLVPVAVFAAAGCATLGLYALMVTARPVNAVRLDDEGDAPVPVPYAILIPAGLVILIGFLAENATEGWSALHLERNLGASAGFGALGPAILGLTMGLGRLSGQMVAQHFSAVTVSAVGAGVAALGALMAAFAPTLAIAYLGFAILGTGVSVTAPMMFAHVGALVPDDQRVTAIARISVIGYAGFFLGPPLMGFLAEAWGLAASFTAVGVLLVAIPLVLAPLLRPRATPPVSSC